MDCQPEPRVDRFLIAAVVDRLIYDSETVFNPEDARVLLDALPHRQSPRFELGIAGQVKGGSFRGFAAGIGSVKIKDKDARAFEYSTAKDAYTRAGQWKLLWSRSRHGQSVEIEQVMADLTDEGRGARIRYTEAGEPTAMDIRFNRALRLLIVVMMFPGWRPWKTPA